MPSRCWPRPTRTGKRFGKTVRAGIALRLDPPVGGRKQAAGSKNHQRVNQQRDHRQFHFARTDFLAQVFGCPPHHLAGQENSDDQEQQQVDHADALAAVYAVDPHSHHRRQRGDRIETVVLAINRAAGHVHRHRREGGAGRRSKTQLLAFQVAQVLIDRQPGNRRDCQRAFPSRRRRAGYLKRLACRMRGKARIGLQSVVVNRPDDRARPSTPSSPRRSPTHDASCPASGRT